MPVELRNVPDDIWKLIIAQLDLTDVVAFARTCQKFSNIWRSMQPLQHPADFIADKVLAKANVNLYLRLNEIKSIIEVYISSLKKERDLSSSWLTHHHTFPTLSADTNALLESQHTPFRNSPAVVVDTHCFQLSHVWKWGSLALAGGACFLTAMLVMVITGARNGEAVLHAQSSHQNNSSSNTTHHGGHTKLFLPWEWWIVIPGAALTLFGLLCAAAGFGAFPCFRVSSKLPSLSSSAGKPNEEKFFQLNPTAFVGKVAHYQSRGRIIQSIAVRQNMSTVAFFAAAQQDRQLAKRLNIQGESIHDAGTLQNWLDLQEKIVALHGVMLNLLEHAYTVELKTIILANILYDHAQASVIKTTWVEPRTAELQTKYAELQTRVDEISQAHPEQHVAVDVRPAVPSYGSINYSPS